MDNFGVYMSSSISVLVDEELLQAVFEGARRLYPREIVLLLRGEKKKSMVKISEVVVPPLATYGSGFANIHFICCPWIFPLLEPCILIPLEF